MSDLIAALILVGIAPNATDGYRANLNSVKVEADFVYKYGVFDWNYTNPHFTAPDKGADPVTTPRVVINATWGYDGTAERLYIPQENATINQRYQTQRPLEALFDGETFAYVEAKSIAFTVDVSRTNEPPIYLYGPFNWWGSQITSILAVEHPRVPPTAQDKAFLGRTYKFNSYTSRKPNSWNKMELYFDPGWNFVPRFGRTMLHDQKGDVIRVKDVLVVDAVQCQAGGFFPVEWYYRAFSVSNVGRKHPGFSDASESLELVGDGEVVMGHFKVTSWRDATSPVALHLEPRVRVIGGLGGSTPSKIATPTLKDLKNQLGRKIDDSPKRPKINVDVKEQRANQPQSSLFLFKSIGFGLASLSLLGILARRLRKPDIVAVLLIVMVASPGCGVKAPAPAVAPSTAAPAVAISFAKELVLCDPWSHSLEDDVTVKNLSGSRLKVLGIDGGCSCRSLDKSAFPFDLEPSGIKKVHISFTRKNDYQEQAIAFKMATDRGPLGAMASLRVVPRLKIIPGNLSVVLQEEEGDRPAEGALTVQVRTIHATGEVPIPFTMTSSPGLTVVQPPSHVEEGTTAFSPDLKFTDVTYQLLIADKTLGLSKGHVELAGQDGRSLTQTAVVWQRRAFLTASPSQVLLADHKIRVFLHSQDESTSFTKVQAAPPGDVAMLISSRE